MDKAIALMKQKKPITVEHTASTIIFDITSKLSGMTNSPRITVYTKYTTAHIIQRYPSSYNNFKCKNYTLTNF
jgi:hypothetical protein